jgi:hypothetical protein
VEISIIIAVLLPDAIEDQKISPKVDPGVLWLLRSRIGGAVA